MTAGLLTDGMPSDLQARAHQIKKVTPIMDCCGHMLIPIMLLGPGPDHDSKLGYVNMPRLMIISGMSQRVYCSYETPA